MSPDEYQELGRRYYKQKQYEKAVHAFTEGIEAANSQSISLLDHRAAAHDKLGKLSLAVKDGRDMIKLDKQCVKVSKNMHMLNSIIDSLLRGIYAREAFWRKWTSWRPLLAFTNTE
jgi:tetratricopeptide (TPR) repeat protein